MSQLLEIEVPDEVLVALQRDASELAGELRLAAAAKWYEMGLLSQEKAAATAGLSRAGFISELARYRVSPFQENADDILASIRTWALEKAELLETGAVLTASQVALAHRYTP